LVIVGIADYDTDYDATAFLSDVQVVFVIPDNGFINGLAVLHRELFVVRGESASSVEVYNNSQDYSLTRHLPIPGSKGLRAIVACPHYNCLYISDPGQKKIFRYDISLDMVTIWSVNGACSLLSLTSSYNILATLYRAKYIHEYATDGALIRVVLLDSSVEGPIHSVQLSMGSYVVSHSDNGSEQERVSIVDDKGSVVQSYDGPTQISEVHVYGPRHMIVDRHDNVIVADYNSSRVELLSATLDHLGDVEIPGYQLNGPSSLHLDELNHRLYIGERTGGRLFVLRADRSEDC